MKATCSQCGKFSSLFTKPNANPKLTPKTVPKGKTSWFGCGSHIPGVLDSVPVDEWCTCEPKVDVDGKKYPPKANK